MFFYLSLTDKNIWMMLIMKQLKIWMIQKTNLLIEQEEGLSVCLELIQIYEYLNTKLVLSLTFLEIMEQIEIVTLVVSGPPGSCHTWH